MWYSDAYVLVKGTISGAGASPKTNDKEYLIFKNCTPFTGYVREINNTQINNAKDIGCMFLSCHVRVSEWIHTL